LTFRGFYGKLACVFDIISVSIMVHGAATTALLHHHFIEAWSITIK